MADAPQEQPQGKPEDKRTVAEKFAAAEIEFKFYVPEGTKPEDITAKWNKLVGIKDGATLTDEQMQAALTKLEPVLKTMRFDKVEELATKDANTTIALHEAQIALGKANAASTKDAEAINKLQETYNKAHSELATWYEKFNQIQFSQGGDSFKAEIDKFSVGLIGKWAARQNKEDLKTHLNLSDEKIVEMEKAAKELPSKELGGIGRTAAGIAALAAGYGAVKAISGMSAKPTLDDNGNPAVDDKGEPVVERKGMFAKISKVVVGAVLIGAAAIATMAVINKKNPIDGFKRGSGVIGSFTEMVSHTLTKTPKGIS